MTSGELRGTLELLGPEDRGVARVQGKVPDGVVPPGLAPVLELVPPHDRFFLPACPEFQPQDRSIRNSS